MLNMRRIRTKTKWKKIKGNLYFSDGERLRTKDKTIYILIRKKDGWILQNSFDDSIISSRVVIHRLGEYRPVRNTLQLYNKTKLHVSYLSRFNILNTLVQYAGKGIL